MSLNGNQIGLVDVENKPAQFRPIVDPFEKPNIAIKWKLFKTILNMAFRKDRKCNAGRPAYDYSKIWAFDTNGTVCSGFPLITEGRVDASVEVNDLEGDGELDLVAVDDAGFIYAWQLDSGSVYYQDWPSKYGNSWNTSNKRYRSGSDVGYVYEDWPIEDHRVPPYKWLETGRDNSVTEISYQYRKFFVDDGIIYADSAGDRNLHFVGPNMAEMKDYTVTGSIKFENSDAQMGINVYSQWPGSKEKYVVERRSDGKIGLRYYTDSLSYSVLVVSDSVYADNAGSWYNFKIKMIKDGNDNTIQSYMWEQGEPDATENPLYKWPIDYTHSSPSFINGTVGLVTISGSGRRYWGPITVTSNYNAPGAYMAYDDFVEDTVVDVKPYLPYDWHPDYSFVRFENGTSVNGFVLDTNSTADTLALTYSHKPGVTYPVICRLIPENNLTWDNYTFKGRIIKPDDPAFDSAEVTIAGYYNGLDSCYKVILREDSVFLKGGKWVTDTFKNAQVFDAGDTLSYEFILRNVTIYNVKDSVIQLEFNVRLNGGAPQELISNTIDGSSNRIKAGVPGIMYNKINQNATGEIRLEKVYLIKQN